MKVERANKLLLYNADSQVLYTCGSYVYIGDGDEELYIASCSITQKVAKQTRFYTTQLGKKEGKTQKQVILACMQCAGEAEDGEMFKYGCAHYHHTQKGRFYTPQLGRRDGSIVRQDKDTEWRRGATEMADLRNNRLQMWV